MPEQCLKKKEAFKKICEIKQFLTPSQNSYKTRAIFGLQEKVARINT